MRIVWDEPKRLSNLRKHQLDFATLNEQWFEEARFFKARDMRLKAIGRLNGRVVAAIIEPLGTEALSIVSLRLARRDERKWIQ